MPHQPQEVFIDGVRYVPAVSDHSDLSEALVAALSQFDPNTYGRIPSAKVTQYLSNRVVIVDSATQSDRTVEDVIADTHRYQKRFQNDNEAHA